MKYLALAVDYDGTIAKDGKVNTATISALKKFKKSGRKLLLVTGRELDELLEILPEIKLFDIVVAENGALIYYPQTAEEKPLADAPPPEFINELRKRNVHPFSVGRVIIGAWRPHENSILDAIRDLGLEMQVIFNKNAVMVLPAGINKALGMAKALHELNLSPLNTASVGDAENDHTFLKASGFSAAVSNAIPMLKDVADLCLKQDHGEGVQELIDLILKTDLEEFQYKIKRHRIVIGEKEGEEFSIRPYNIRILAAGSPWKNKPVYTLNFAERLIENGYQCCIIDPEGDYKDVKEIISSGSGQHTPDIEKIISSLKDPKLNTAVNLSGVDPGERPAFLRGFYSSLIELYKKTGRPHWIIANGTQPLLPHYHGGNDFPGIMYVAENTEHIESQILESIDLVLVFGEKPEKTIKQLSTRLKLNYPDLPKKILDNGEAIAWQIKPPDNKRDQIPVLIRTIPPKKIQNRRTLK